MSAENEPPKIEELEREKIALEIQEMRKPFFAKPANWLSIAAAVAALGGVIGQSLVSNYKVERARLETAEQQKDAKEKVEAAQQKVDELEQSANIAEAQRLAAEAAAENARITRIQLRADHRALKEQIKEARQGLEQTETLVAKLASDGADPEILDEILGSIGRTSEALGRTCTEAEASAYDSALLVDTAEKPSLRRMHFPWGLPVYKGAANDILEMVQPWWIGGFSPSRKLPLWVGYRLDKESLSRTERKDCWRPDPRLEAGSMASLQDYKRSGYDRGHLVASVDVGVSESAMASTYIVSNLTPQTPNLNRGAILNLEKAVREWAEHHGELYVIIGPIFDNNGDMIADAKWSGPVIGEGKIPVPSHFFRIVLRASENGEISALSFIHPNQPDVDRKASISEFQVDINSVERATGLEFFPSLSESESAELKQNLGKLSDW